MNSFTGHGVFGRDKRQGTSFTAATLPFESLAELWRGDDLAARAVETLPKEALREGYDLIIPQTEDDAESEAESERVAEVMDKLDKLGCDQILRIALGYERGLGGGAVLIGANDRQTDLTTPLDLDKVTSLDWLTPLEARELYPVYGYADPRAPKYGLPEIYRLTSRAILPPQGGTFTQTVMEIHESRLLIFPGIRISRYQNMASQGGWGDSVLIRMYRVLRDFNLAWGSAGLLVSDFAKGVYKMADLWDTLASADGEAAFAQRLASMDLSSSTINATVIDGNDDYKRDSTPLSGLPDLMDKFATRLAAAADLPLTLLFGTSPAGLNATGESDIRFFYDRVASYQRDKILPHLTKLVEIIFRTTGDKQVPEKWSIRFKPLWQESAADRAKAQLTQAQADHIWITDQVYSAEEAADSHWGTGEWQPEISIDFDARKKQKMATSSPVSAKDLDAMGKPINPNYNPPPQSRDPAAPNYQEPPDTGDDGEDAAPEEKTDALQPLVKKLKKKVPKGFRDYVPPPPQGSLKRTPDTTPPGPPAAPDPNTRPQEWIQADSADAPSVQIPDEARAELTRFWTVHPTLRQACVEKYGFDPIDEEADYWRHGLAEPDHREVLASVRRNHGVFSLALVRQWEAEESRAARGDDWDESLHPRAANGEFGVGSGGEHPEKDPEPAREHGVPESHTARKLLEYAKESEAAGRGAGFTYNPGEGKFATEGYSVSTHPGHEMLIHGHDVDEQTIQHYVDNPERQQLFKNDPKATIGGWYDPERDEWNLDVSHVESDRATAVRLAQQYGQRGIYDLKRGETINAHEYEQALAGTGKFAGRKDSAGGRGEGPLRPAQDVARGDRRRDERDPAERAGQARARLDSWVGWRADSDDVHLDSDQIADAVNEQLKEDYRPADRKWILDTRWEGPKRVPVDAIDWSGRKGWQASQDEDEEHVQKFCKRIRQGWDKPIILVQRPGFQKLFIVDGHHRALAYRQLDCPALAYVGYVPTPDGPWNSFHDLQREKKDAVDRVDEFNPDQPRGPDGKWAAGGGGGDAKIKESLGTVGKAREAAYSPPRWGSSNQPLNTRARAAEEQLKAHAAAAKAEAPKFGYNGAAEEAKARAGRDAGMAEYEKQLAANRGPDPSVDLDKGPGRYEVVERGERIQNQEQLLSEQEKEGHEAPNTLRGQPNLPDPAFGAMKFEGDKAKELEDRVQEALKNNAKMGEHGEAPDKVIADVHQRMAQEKVELEKRQAAAREKEAKLAAIRAEREAKIKAADEEVAKLQNARRKANDDWQEAMDAYNAAKDAGKSDEELKKLGDITDDLESKYAAAVDARDAARKEREALNPKSPERTSSAKNLSDLSGSSVVETKGLGGGANETQVAILDDESKAIYKPRDGEAGELRRNVEAGTYYIREAAASQVAEQLGVADLVPATVVHDGPDGPGSLQAFVPDAETLANRYDETTFDRDAAERMRVFDWVTGNSDRHDGNVMVVEKEDRTLPILIDNGLSFPNGTPQRMIQPYDYVPHEPLSDKTVSFVHAIDGTRLAATLANAGIERTAVRHTIARLNMVKSNPQMLSAEREHTASYDWDEVPEPTREDLAAADKVLADPSVKFEAVR